MVSRDLHLWPAGNPPWPGRRNEMKRSFAALAIAVLVALGGLASLTAVRAAPPTVTPSPGYDARLQEQRAAPAYYEPGVRASRPGYRRHLRRSHRGAYR
jgi:hypothetical protein